MGAVRIGRKHGIYNTAEEATEQVKGFKNGTFKKFKSEEDANNYINNLNKDTKKQRYYAVTIGRELGVFDSLAKARKQVINFSNRKMRVFKTLEEANIYFQNNLNNNHNNPNNQNNTDKVNEVNKVNKVTKNKKQSKVKSNTIVKSVLANHVFVDGSYNHKTKAYGYGGIMFCNKGVFTFKGNGIDERFAGLEALSGELMAAIEAIKLGIELKLKELTIVYDCEAIELYSKERKKSNQTQKEYKEIIDDNRNKIKIYFQKVKSHSGIEGNEMADIIAKSASGVKLTTSEKTYLEIIDKMSNQI